MVQTSRVSFRIAAAACLFGSQSCDAVTATVSAMAQVKEMQEAGAAEDAPHPVRFTVAEDINSEHYRETGDGPGRPLYALNTVELPGNMTGRHCICLRMDKRTHSVTVDANERDINTIAHGCYEDRASDSGWSSLTISSTHDDDVPLVVRAWGAGLVEGVLTFTRMEQFSHNVEHLLLKDNPGLGPRAAVERVVRLALVAWEEYAGGDAAVEPRDDISRQAWAALIQMRGIRDGYNLLAYRNQEARLSALQVMMMNMHAELPSLIELYSRSEQAKAFDRSEHAHDEFDVEAEREDHTTLSHHLREFDHGVDNKKNLSKDHSEDHSEEVAVEEEEFDSLLQTGSSSRGVNTHKHSHDHTLHHFRYASAGTAATKNEASTHVRWSRYQPGGSALVKRLGPLQAPEDLLAGHVTMGDYGEMTRIMKTYDLHFKTPNHRVTLSSYPGCISSTDDYFITERGFVYMSTNLWVPDSGEYSMPARTNDGLPNFLRAMIATRLATQPRSWARIYGFVNGLAGAKQWLIVDYGKLKPAQPIANDTVWLVESMPRLQRAGDVSQAIRDDGFFQAHGVPHFRQIREAYGLDAFGPGSYEEARQSALLDKAGTVETLASAREVLTEADPSRGAGQIPVTARNDLDPIRPIPAGGIDAKVTSKCMVSKMGMQARSGPPLTTNGDPFEWRDEDNNEFFPGWPHSGLENTWNFGWTNVLPGRLEYPIAPDDEECEN